MTRVRRNQTGWGSFERDDGNVEHLPFTAVARGPANVAIAKQWSPDNF